MGTIDGDVVEFDEWVRRLGVSQGVPEVVMRSKEEVDALRAERRRNMPGSPDAADAAVYTFNGGEMGGDFQHTYSWSAGLASIERKLHRAESAARMRRKSFTERNQHTRQWWMSEDKTDRILRDAYYAPRNNRQPLHNAPTINPEPADFINGVKLWFARLVYTAMNVHKGFPPGKWIMYRDPGGLNA